MLPDVELVTLREGEINELYAGLKGTIDAFFLTDLAEKSRRGQPPAVVHFNNIETDQQVQAVA